MEGVLEVVVHLPRRLAPTHLLLRLVLTQNQARGRLERRQAVRPAYLNVYVGCIERTRRDTSRMLINLGHARKKHLCVYAYNGQFKRGVKGTGQGRRKCGCASELLET